MASTCKRIESDVMKLLMSDYEVTLANDNSVREFYVRFHGPEDTPFASGVWKVRVEVPNQYPYKSPSIGFVNRIFHPNIDEMSGSVCLDVINQTWSPIFDMVNIFEVFLPQLLRYPNPSDPLNGEAASLLIRDPFSYEMKVKDHVLRYASTTSGLNKLDSDDNLENSISSSILHDLSSPDPYHMNIGCKNDDNLSAPEDDVSFFELSEHELQDLLI